APRRGRAVHRLDGQATADREHDAQGRRAAGDDRAGLMHPGVAFVLACAVVAGGYHLFEWFASWWFFRHAARTIHTLPPGVALTLCQTMCPARHDILVVRDGDIRVRPDYLRAMVGPLVDPAAGPAIGLTTCLYRGVGCFGLPTVLESLFINTDFMPMVLSAQLVDRFEYAYGASIAFRREALEAIGGFPALADYLADDYHLGNRIARAGYRLVLLPYT